MALASATSKPGAVLSLMRPKQWVKNLFVFAAWLFAGTNSNVRGFEGAILAFFLFCLAASSVYILNDLFDLERDRTHRTKKLRPLARGLISPALAKTLALVLGLSALLGAATFGRPMLYLITLYLMINISYSIWFKHQPIVDVLLLSSGFVIRAWAGLFAASVPASKWFIVCVMLVSLYLGLGKRRSEVLAGYGSEARPVLTHYPIEMLNNLLPAMLGAIIVTYLLFTIQDPHKLMPLTIPFVLYGLFRYEYLSTSANNVTGDGPDALVLRDKPLLLTLCLWTLSVFLLVKL